MKKFTSVVKSVLILGLAALAVFQISRLWFVNLTNRNFFLYLAARFPVAVPDGQNAWARPFRIIYGSERYNIRYSGIENSFEWEFGLNALDAIIRSGSFAGIIDADSSRITNRVGFIFEYNFQMCSETFTRAMGRRRGGVLTGQGPETFSSIVIQPPIEGDSLLRAFFLSEGRAWEFTLQPGSGRHSAEDFALSVPYVRADGLYFVRSEGIFLPRFGGDFYYRSAIPRNPHHDRYGHLFMSSIRPHIEHFFANPVTIHSSVRADVYTFSNLSTMVRYHPNDVLEYTSYRRVGRTTPAGILSDFSVARAFIARDISNDTEIYFAGYDVRGSEYIFRFNFVFDNFPMIMISPWPTSANCNDPLYAPLEITVEHGRVVRYRRLAINFIPGSRQLFNSEDPNIDGEIRLGFVLDRNEISHTLPLTVFKINPKGAD